MNLRPLCTAIVCPTISGMTVDRRDHVLMTTFLSRDSLATSTFFFRWESTNGPFLIDLDIAYFLRRTIIESVRLLLRVFMPFVFQPQGETGWRPPEVFPSPPPI